MKKQSKLRQIANILMSSANELEKIDQSIKLARNEIKQILKQANLKLPVETRHTKKETYIKVTYQGQKPKLPDKVQNIPIRVVKKKS